MLVFMNYHLDITGQYSPMITLQVTFSVKQHKEPAEHILSHSVLHYSVSPDPPCFGSIDRHQPLFSLFLWPPWWLNQSGHVRSGTHIPLLRAFRILEAIVLLYIRFIVCLTVVFPLIWIIRVTVPVEPIFSVQNAFGCTVIMTVNWMTVDSPYSANIQHLCLSSSKFLCRQSWWQWWSFRQFKCSCTLMLKEWPGCFDAVFCIWNVSYGCNLFVSSGWFLLCSM